MYNSLLTKVHTIIRQTTQPTWTEKLDVDYYSMFNPAGAQQQVENMRKRQDLGQKLIIGTTIVACVGEAVHLFNRSGIVEKILKK